MKFWLSTFIICFLLCGCKKEKKSDPHANFEVFNEYDYMSQTQGTVSFKNTSLNASFYKWEITGDSGLVHTYEYKDIAHRFYSNGLFKVKLTVYDEKRKKSSELEKEIEVKTISELTYKLNWYDSVTYEGKTFGAIVDNRSLIWIEFFIKNPKVKVIMYIWCCNAYHNFTLGVSNGNESRVNKFYIEMQAGNLEGNYTSSGAFTYLYPELVVADQFKFDSDFNATKEGRLVSTLEKKTFSISGKIFCYTKRPC